MAAHPNPRRDRNADPWPSDDLFPTVNWRAWRSWWFAGWVIASSLVVGALGLAVEWAARN